MGPGQDLHLHSKTCKDAHSQDIHLHHPGKVRIYIYNRSGSTSAWTRVISSWGITKLGSHALKVLGLNLGPRVGTRWVLRLYGLMLVIGSDVLRVLGFDALRVLGP
eukprot:2687444-Amphidinium_carterae.1